MREAATFDEFYIATRQRTVHQMYAMLGDLGEAEDVTQEAYGRAWRQWSQVSRMADPQGWVRTVAWRLAANSLRHRRRAARRLLLREPVPPTAAPSVDNVALLDALRQLPADQRRAIVLHYLADLTVEQAAAESGASVSAVKSRLARGRAALAALLDDDCPEERYV
jgi:RNA polymerase sigma-70 factor (ECF subfamily)